MSKVLKLLEDHTGEPEPEQWVLDNPFLISFLGGLLGECIASDTDSCLFAYEDNEYGVIVEKDFVGVADDGSILPATIMYSIIGYCIFHKIPYKHV